MLLSQLTGSSVTHANDLLDILRRRNREPFILEVLGQQFGLAVQSLRYAVYFPHGGNTRVPVWVSDIVEHNDGAITGRATLFDLQFVFRWEEGHGLTLGAVYSGPGGWPVGDTSVKVVRCRTAAQLADVVTMMKGIMVSNGGAVDVFAIPDSNVHTMLA